MKIDEKHFYIMLKGTITYAIAKGIEIQKKTKPGECNNTAYLAAIEHVLETSKPLFK